MPTYIIRMRFTAKGIEQIREGPARIEAARQLLRSLGGDLKAWYLTTGRYDSEAIVEAPDDDTLARFALGWASRGTVSTETSRAWTEEEAARLVENLP